MSRVKQAISKGNRDQRGPGAGRQCGVARVDAPLTRRTRKTVVARRSPAGAVPSSTTSRVSLHDPAHCRPNPPPGGLSTGVMQKQDRDQAGGRDAAGVWADWQRELAGRWKSDGAVAGIPKAVAHKLPSDRREVSCVLGSRQRPNSACLRAPESPRSNPGLRNLTPPGRSLPLPLDG
jgi:hypothetical protein